MYVYMKGEWVQSVYITFRDQKQASSFNLYLRQSLWWSAVVILKNVTFPATDFRRAI